MIKEKLMIIGPVYPYKGGIAHYTSLLYKQMNEKYKVKLISFKRLYPEFLYPGKMQIDHENKYFQIADAEYLLDTINPFTWLFTAMKIKKYKPRLIIFQWWNPFFAPVYISILFFTKIFTRSKSLFICHNVLPHEKIPLDKAITKFVLKKVDYHIVQSEEDAKHLLLLKPTASYRVTAHPNYSAFKNEAITKEEACLKLKLDSNSKVVLYFGFVREYKGLIYLIKAMSKVVFELQNIKLIIAGEFFDDKLKYVTEISKLNLQDKIIVHDRYIPDEDVKIYFSAADLVVLPYTSATQSGIVQIAYAFNKPVIVTRVGGLPEVVEDGKTGFIVEPKNSEQISEAIVGFYNDKREYSFIDTIKALDERFSWKRLVETIEDLSLS